MPLRKGHITTRQNIQMHHVPLPDAAKLIREIGETGLSSREGCGNTMRNVTGDPYAGVCADEPFDITPYAAAYVRYFVRHPTAQAMPRKFKTAFTASDADRAIVGIHDLGFIPRLRDGVRGVEVVVGGGTSIMPRVAPTLYEFVELDNGDYIKVTEAVLRIFDRQEWLRVNRARARIKVLVDKIGIDAFREMVEEELEGDWVGERDFTIDRLLLDHDEEANAPAMPAAPASPNGERTEFERFAASNVRPQRQEGFSTVVVKVERGDLTPDQLRGLAAIMRDYTGGYARTTVEQNSRAALGARPVGLRRLDPPRRARPRRGRRRRDHRRRLLPGHRHVQARHHQLDGPEPRHLRADPGDGDHRPADQAGPHQDVRAARTGAASTTSRNIGFYGASIKVGERTIPAYIAHVGGNDSGADASTGSASRSRLPAKRVPEAVERWLRMYEAERATARRPSTPSSTAWAPTTSRPR